MMPWRRALRWLRSNMRVGHHHRYEKQVDDVSRRTRTVIHDLADAVIRLRTVADEVESALVEMEDDD